MNVSISIDVSDIEEATAFYTNALGCELKKSNGKRSAIVAVGNIDVYLQAYEVGSVAAADERRHYGRHWTPVHLDFGVADVRQAAAKIEAHGGTVERQAFSDQADIAVCADPFGNGFCVIRE